MKYEISVSRAACGDLIPLVLVAEAIAKLEATSYGTLPLHVPTLESSRASCLRSLYEDAKEGRLEVCTGAGVRIPASRLNHSQQVTKSESDQPSTEPYELWVKEALLKKWAEANGDAIEISDTQSDAVEFGSELADGTKAYRGLVFPSGPKPMPNEDLPGTPDFAQLATPGELLSAFRQVGLRESWFKDLASHDWLRSARKVKGHGQRGHRRKPLFCPYEVMLGLARSARSSRLDERRGWHILETEFPHVYAAHEAYDPRKNS